MLCKVLFGYFFIFVQILIFFQLCGSPLDYLPCKIEVTCQHFSGSFKDKILDLLNKKVDEIKMRSLAVEDRWAFINPSNSQFGIGSLSFI